MIILLRPVHAIYSEINSIPFACLSVHGVIVVAATVAVLVASSLRRGCVVVASS